MALHSANGLSVASAVTDAHAVFGIWNPHATKRIYLREFSVVAVAAPGAGAGIEARRMSARGTPGSTVTPGIENADERDAASQSGWLLDFAAYSVQPTLVAASPLRPSWVFAAVIGSGLIYPYAGRGLAIPPGTGIVFINRAAIIFPASEVSVLIEE